MSWRGPSPRFWNRLDRHLTDEEERVAPVIPSHPGAGLDRGRRILLRNPAPLTIDIPTVRG